jgi:ATP-dependent DNA ligase
LRSTSCSFAARICAPCHCSSERLRSKKKLTRTERIVYCKHIGETGEKLFQAADQLGLEGVIGKRADSPYRAGRTPNWVKVKTAHGRHIDEERAKWNE